MPLPFTSDEIQKAYSTNLIEYAKLQGFDIKKADRKSYKVKGYGGLYLFPHAFHHFSCNESGHIIDFCKVYQGLDYLNAIEQILGTKAYSNTILPLVNEPKGTLELPPKSKNNDKAIKYLVNDRCVDLVIVKDFIEQGKIYQAETSNKGMVYENCAFVSFYKDKPKYCALRGFGISGFRQDVKNSDKTYGFSMVGTSDRIFCFEAPIDLLSHATLCKLNGINYMSDNRISEGCLSDKALTRFLKDNPHIKEIIFCFDNDVDGKDHKGNAHNHGQEFALKCAEKFSKLGYKTQIQTPIRKDWNEDLQYIQKSVIKELRSRQSVASKNDMEVKQYER